MEQWLIKAKQRMGQRNYDQRHRLEDKLRRQRTDRQVLGNFLNALLPSKRHIRLAFKLSGLHNRGLQNIFKIQLEQQTWELPTLPKDADGLTILQLSDLHLDIHPDLPAVILEKLDGLDYDLCVITGDYRNHARSSDEDAWIEPMQKVLAKLNKPYYGIAGNHDDFVLMRELEEMGLPLLLNESVPIKDKLYLCGVDDASYFKSHDYQRAAKDIPDDACKILLAHAPLYMEEAATCGYDLAFCGHTHAGQVCLPGGFPLLRHASAKVMAGRWKKGRLQGYTARGTGSCTAPYRFNCPPEITLHTLKSTASTCS